MQDKDLRAAILQQVEIIKEDIAGIRPGQCMAQVVHQHGDGGGIAGAVVPAQHIEPGMGKGVLYALPKDGQAVRVHVDAQHLGARHLRTFVQIPVDGGGLAVAHRRHDQSQRAAADHAQLGLQLVGQIEGVQIYFVVLHFVTALSDWQNVSFSGGANEIKVYIFFGCIIQQILSKRNPPIDVRARKVSTGIGSAENNLFKRNKSWMRWRAEMPASYPAFCWVVI